MSEILAARGVLSPQDIDTFSLHVRAGERFVVRLDGVLADSAVPGAFSMNVRTAEGEWLVGVSKWSGTAPWLSAAFTAPRDGVVLIQVVGDRVMSLEADPRLDATGFEDPLAQGQAAAVVPWFDYSLTVAPIDTDAHADTKDGGTPVAVGQTIAATLDQPGDRDWFRVHLQQGERLMLLSAQFEGLGSSLGLTVLDPQGDPVSRQGGWGGSYFLFEAAEVGWYDIGLFRRDEMYVNDDGLMSFFEWSGQASEVKPYQIHLHSLAPDDHGDTPELATPLHLGTEMRFVLDHDDDLDWLSLQPRPGKLYRLAAVDDDGQIMEDVKLRLMGSTSQWSYDNGEIIFAARDDDALEVSLSAPWDLLLSVGGELPPAPERSLAGRLVWEPLEEDPATLFGDAWADLSTPLWPEPEPIHIALGGLPEQPLQFELQPGGTAEVLLPLAAGDRVRYTLTTELTTQVYVHAAWGQVWSLMPAAFVWQEHSPSGDAGPAESTAWFEAPAPGLYAFDLWPWTYQSETPAGEAAAVRLELTVQPPDDHGDTLATAEHLALGQLVVASLELHDVDMFRLDVQAGTPYLLTVALDEGAELEYLWMSDREYVRLPLTYGEPMVINVYHQPQTSGLQTLSFSGNGLIRFSLTELPADDHGDSVDTATLLNPPPADPLALDELVLVGLPDAAPTTGFDAVALAFAA